MNLENTQTLKNLARAFVTETQDGARYQFVRQLAMQQQLNFVANTMKTLATNEMAHAKIWWDFITDKDKVSFKNIDVKAGFTYETGDLVRQLEVLSQVEKHEGEKIYIEFANTARKEGFEPIATAFEHAAEVENQHSQILKQLHEGLKNNTLYKDKQEAQWKCGKCGFESTAKSAWKVCPLCKEPQGYAIAQIQM